MKKADLVKSTICRSVIEIRTEQDRDKNTGRSVKGQKCTHSTVPLMEWNEKKSTRRTKAKHLIV